LTVHALSVVDGVGQSSPVIKVRFGGIVNFDAVKVFFAASPHLWSELAWLRYDEGTNSKPGHLFFDLTFERIDAQLTYHCYPEDRMRHWILFVYVVALGIQTGAGLFTSVVVYRVWAASPEVVIGWKPTMPYFMEEGWFFMFASPTTTLLALVVAATMWRAKVPSRPWALGSALAFIVVAAVTGAYFLPIQDEVHGDAGAALPREELAGMLEQFVALNWIRQAILVSAFIAAIHGLGLSYRNLQRESGITSAGNPI
jgi:hypothetical protein